MDGTLLGIGRTQGSRVPVEVPGLRNVAELAAGPLHTCARLTDGTVRCWGSNDSGEVGDGTFRSGDRPTPVAVVGLTHAVEIAVGGFRSCARLADGTARCWGANAAAPQRDGSVWDTGTPVAVVGLTRAAGIAVGYSHVCARLTDNTVRCWGSNETRQLGREWALRTPVTVRGLP
jgi:alpha-tubulin suppressor-like RCC1 family protein